MMGTAPPGSVSDHVDQRALMRRIIAAYDAPVVRAYCFIRFLIININILHILGLCLRGKRRILEIGCGFGLFGCYFASRWPTIEYQGIDIDASRIALASRAAGQLALTNAHFACGDAAGPLRLEGPYDAVLMMDLLHHLPDQAKQSLLDAVTAQLAPGGHLIIKEVTRRPFWKMAFTWTLDAVMTKGFDMWYWHPRQFRGAVNRHLDLETYPIADWLPYPHIVYLFTKPDR
jgi:2-polyprenyl-3-methyl-5-hydroxy-6-metoxy-1,4-benzoquinol methylase